MPELSIKSPSFIILNISIASFLPHNLPPDSGWGYLCYFSCSCSEPPPAPPGCSRWLRWWWWARRGWEPGRELEGQREKLGKDWNHFSRWGGNCFFIQIRLPITRLLLRYTVSCLNVSWWFNSVHCSVRGGFLEIYSRVVFFYKANYKSSSIQALFFLGTLYTILRPLEAVRL